MKKVRSCAKVFVFPVQGANSILGFLALQLLVQKERYHNFWNDFIQLLNPCYNININEQFILYLSLLLINYKGVSNLNKFSLFII